MIRIAILGSTGSIGESALSVVDAHRDRVTVVALAAGHNTTRLAQQARKYRPALVSVATDDGLAEVTAALSLGERPAALESGANGLLAAATHPDVDLVLCASSGAAGLEAAFAAIEHGKTVALANKEVLVMAGDLMVAAARKHGVSLLPVDSEHNAIHQCLHGRTPDEVRRLILTASGGPFRDWSPDALARVTPADALRHPTWQMGRKITIDSSTLMNKGLEVIEARWLFDVAPSQIDVVVHPQSIVHSMVELRDGSVIAQLGVTDMRLPIQYAFSYPDRWDAPVPSLDVTRMGRLDFAPPDLDQFRCLRLAYDALAHGGAWPVVLNAANEVAVSAFLEGRLGFLQIPVVIERLLDAAGRETSVPRSLADVRATDAWARHSAAETISTLPSSKP
jgi:1-deoxy-D-xylulose-5-phosphate reductoisomerase